MSHCLARRVSRAISGIATAERILQFWFEELTPEQRFEKDGVADRRISREFTDAYEALAERVPTHWGDATSTCLAAIIALDQFPRNLYRGQARAFATDHVALALANHAINAGLDDVEDITHRMFFYLPFEHSESIADQERSVELFTALNDERLLDYAVRHRDVIKRFGRFPHRNAALNRASTNEELAFIDEPGSGF